MTERRRSRWARTAWLGLAAGLALILTGDQGAQTSTLIGIDPLEVMNSRIKSNILFLVDTSGSMKWSVHQDLMSVGSDDEVGRLGIVKKALSKAVTVYQGQANFGLATFQATDAQKTLSGGIAPVNDFDGDARFDGPLVYATTDPNGAYWAGRFNGVTDNNNGATGYPADAFASFMNTTPYNTGHPAGCVAGVNCTYYVQSRMLRNAGSLFIWDTLLTPPLLVAELPGLFPTNCFAFEDGGGNNAVYCYRSGLFRLAAGGGNPDGCGQPTAAATAVAACSADSVPTIKTHLALELPLDANGNPANVAGAPTVIEDTNTPVAGLRADQPTSLAQALAGASAFLPTPLASQKDYIILITDNFSDASLTESAVNLNSCGGTALDQVTAAATMAKNLFNGAKGIETLVVALGSANNGVGVDRANIIAHAGTGQPAAPNLCTPSDPTARCRDAFVAQTGSDTATIQTELEHAIETALDRAMWGGTYSAAQPIVASVFELGTGDSPSGEPVNPLDPRTRYDNRVNILYQSTFDVPGFRGHLLAFRNDGSFQPVGNNNTKGFFEAGETMFEKLSQAPQGLEDKVGRNGNLDEYVFAELHGGATVDNIDQSPGVGALLKRRVFTSPGNGDFQTGRNPGFGAAGGYDSGSASGRNVVALWPPNQAGLANTADVDPADWNVPATVASGVSLDDALGIGPNSSPVLTFDQLRERFGACAVSTELINGAPAPLPAECNDPAQQWNFARKEAREIILVHMVGARVKRSLADGLPMRAPAGAPVDPPGTLFFEDRGWTFPDTTNSTPAVVTPPLRSTPDKHVSEFVLFRDGRRDENRQGINEIDLGFGLRNPDFDDAFPETKTDLKPIMTTIYIGAQDMLHAFRAGPNCGDADPTQCKEQGGEELWGFVPFDLLVKQKDMILRPDYADPTSRGYVIRGPSLPVLDADPVNPPNDRDHHTYGIASSIRVADIFVPGSFTPPPVPGSAAITFAGRWRTVLFFGRGPGGKFYTALDVTAPGPFTRNALKTNPPWVMWNQGNVEDEVDPYDQMGQTWSVPAVGNLGVTSGTEWVAWTGSGYGTGVNAATEGSAFYMLDAATGAPVSIITTDGQTWPAVRDLGDGTATFIANNALVANPAGFNKFQLDDPTLPQRSEDKVTRVYIPDLHGRIWKFPATSNPWANFGPSQPFGNGAALLKLPDGSQELVFASSGNDPRVPLNLSPPFNAYGLNDKNPADSINGLPTASINFTQAWANPLNTSIKYRGTTSPSTGFATDASLGTVGRVFFAGSRYIGDLLGNGCASTFDTLLFAFGAVSGGAAYDFSANTNVTTGGAGFATMMGNKTTGVQVVAGQVIVGQSGGIGSTGQNAPPAPPPPPGAGMPPPAPPAPPFIITLALKPSSAVCRSQ
jgi:hypothetical protein